MVCRKVDREGEAERGAHGGRKKEEVLHVVSKVLTKSPQGNARGPRGEKINNNRTPPS